MILTQIISRVEILNKKYKGKKQIVFSVGKIAEKAVCKSVFLTTWHYILSAKVPHSFRLFFAHWVMLFGKVTLTHV